ncbi:MAG: hypothetical protein M0Q49_09560, partial [Porticoccaceae bacterium]|nr:hypothetical protein [Porticoccaceae bacterium]
MSDEDKLLDNPEDDSLDDVGPDEPEDTDDVLATNNFPREEAMDAANLYLREIGFAALLTAEEEVYYARLVQKGDEKAR